MASGATTRRDLPFPTGSDSFTLRSDVQSLAEALDDVAFDRHGTLAARPPANTVPEGTYYFAENVGQLARSDGSTWRDIALADAAAGTPSMRTLGTSPTSATAGNDPRLFDTRTPTDGSVRNQHVAADAAIGEGKLALASDAAVGTPSRRTLGPGPLQAAPGNDPRFSDARAPLAHKGTHEPGSSDALTALTHLSMAAANRDGAAATPSLRTLGTGAQQAAAGNDARFSDARSPISHAARHAPGGSDAMPVDAAAGTGSLRTLGGGANQACAGNDPRLSSSAHWVGTDVIASDVIRAYDGGAAMIALGRTATGVVAPGITFGLSQDTNIYRRTANVLKTDDAFEVAGELDPLGTFFHKGGRVGFFNAGTNVRGNISGSRTDGSALSDLLVYLESIGLLVNSSNP